ncbi:MULTISPECIES: hypothetical protein [Mycobacterium]|uniref:Uncharacterized protein n=1 Tax=Mycobacterium gordonae TaxID=1778 RepID=A0A1A6BFS6_MYCGO|nr:MULTISPECIES: hypothetical protein [Mycobacterium]MCV7005045.1 hypothetical protein [Mycobacterium gordonae]OBS01079.1 hypothetical protein A9W98_21695 [Mycobacterium gordonae]ODR18471.1 hypothetical protein BHQ23_22860 [Mycobacterium gordonae]ORV73516.1 hypothetical protein AWC08_01865 [Mycobacterium gordonae]PJE12987.1 MAG: hypothetical protein CK428_11065 [Mycobacterium sp.]
MTGLLVEAELDFDALDAEVAELIAEVDAILCAAVAVARRPPAPPVTASVALRPWHGPAHSVRAVQRSPPASPIVGSTTG